MGIILVSEPISLKDLRQAGEELFGDMVKAVVDVEQEVIAAGAELHADEKLFSWNEIHVKRICGESIYILSGYCPK